MSASPYGAGSLNRSNTTDPLALNAVATDRQNATPWSRSGSSSCSVEAAVPGALRCRSSTATNPYELSSAT